MDVPCDASDYDLFSACSKICLGNRAKATFLRYNWLEGESSAVVAHELFKLAFRKKLSVRDALTNGNRMRGLQRMSTERQMDQFISIWMMIQRVTLTNEPDVTI
jgi:hypothetical protein